MLRAPTMKKQSSFLRSPRRQPVRNRSYKPLIEILEERVNPSPYNPAWNSNLVESAWMAGVPGNLMLQQLSIPGTHDSATFTGYYESQDSRFPEILTTIGQIALQTRTQILDIRQQLDLGIRLLDLRPGLSFTNQLNLPGYGSQSVSDLEIYHNNTYLGGDAYGATLWRIFLDIKSFLGDHPTETVLINVKPEHAATPNDVAPVIYDMARKYPGYWYTGTVVPRLDDVRGKIVLLTNSDWSPTVTPVVVPGLNYDKTMTFADGGTGKSTTQGTYNAATIDPHTAMDTIKNAEATYLNTALATPIQDHTLFRNSLGGSIPDDQTYAIPQALQGMTPAFYAYKGAWYDLRTLYQDYLDHNWFALTANIIVDGLAAWITNGLSVLAGLRFETPMNSTYHDVLKQLAAGRTGLFYMDFPEALNLSNTNSTALVDDIIGLNYSYIKPEQTDITTRSPGNSTTVTLYHMTAGRQVRFGVSPWTAGTFGPTIDNGDGTYSATFTASLSSTPLNPSIYVTIDGTVCNPPQTPLTIANAGVRVLGGGAINAGGGVFHLYRNLDASQALTVTLAIGGTAQLGTDYTLSGGTFNVSADGTATVTFPAGSKGFDLTISPVNNRAATAAHKSITLTLQDGNYVIDPDNRMASATITGQGLIVTNTNSSGDGSLYVALANAGTLSKVPATITFGGPVFADSTPDEIQVASGTSLDIVTTNNAGITIEGPGAALLTIRAATTGAMPVFDNQSTVNCEISGLTIVGGSVGIANEGTLTVRDCSVTGNTVAGLTNVADEKLVVYDSAIYANGAAAPAQFGGGIANRGTLYVANTTIVGNTAGYGAGVSSVGPSPSATLANCTVANNHAVLVSGTCAMGGGLFGGFTLYNTIVAGNTADVEFNDLDGGLDQYSYNSLIGDAHGASIGDGVNGFIVGIHGTGVRPLSSILQPTLTSDGDPTPYYRLVAGSVAIDAGVNWAAADADGTLLLYDQRGVGFARVRGGVVDLGAVEGVSDTAGVRIGGGAIINAMDGRFLDAGNVLSGGSLTFRLHRTGATTSPQVVTLNVSGTAALDTDFSLTSADITFAGTTGTVTFPAGHADVYLKVTCLSDNVDRTVNFKLSGAGVNPDADTDFAVLNNDGMLVVNTNNSQEGSLRFALFTAQALSSGTVRFGGPVFEDNVPDVITLTDPLVVHGHVTLVGPGANMLTVHQANSTRSVFQTYSVVPTESPVVIVSGLTLSGGTIGVLNTDTDLTLRDCSISGNLLGIENDATLAVTDCTISDNHNTDASNPNGGGIRALGSSFTISNSTISDNSTLGAGAGVYSASGTFVARNCTITGNQAGTSGGGTAGSGITLFNTIVAGNTAGIANSPSDIAGTLASASSHNLIGDATTSGGLHDGVSGNIVGVGGVGTRLVTTILDTTLTNRGGTTPTHSLVRNSPAIDAGDTSRALDPTGATLGYDQRGEDFLRVRNGTVDIGAFESGATPTVTNASADNLTDTTATLHGIVTNDGGSDIVRRGVVYARADVNSSPILGGPGVATIDDTLLTTGSLSLPVSGLTPLTTYALVAFATNSGGTAYSAARTFTTLPLSTATDVKASQQAVTYGSSVTFTATVTASLGSAAPTGSVNFLDGTTLLGAGIFQSSRGTSSVWTFITGPRQLEGSQTHFVRAAFSATNAFADSFGTIGERVNLATLTYVANPVRRSYGSPNPAFTGTVTGFVPGDTLANATTGTMSFTSTTAATTPLGNYAITGAGLRAPNYAFQQAVANSTALTITPAPLTIVVDNQTKPYGTANPPLTGHVAGIVNNDQVTVNYTTTATTASGVRTGGYPITVASLSGADAAKYAYDPARAAGASVTNGTLAVTPVQLTITPAANQSKIYSAPLPRLTYTAGGFVSPDTSALLRGNLGSAATVTSPIGTYDFTLGTLSAGANYTLALASSPKFTVTAAPTATSISSSANPVFEGQAVTFRASVVAPAPATLMPSGTVQFTLDGQPLGIPVTLVSGQAQVTTTLTASGTGPHRVTATYVSATTNFNNSVSNPLQESVNPATSARMQILVDQAAAGSQSLSFATTPAQLGTLVNAINDLKSPSKLVTITLVLNGGTYDGVTISPPLNVKVVFSSSGGSVTFVGHSSALTVTSGQISVQRGVSFTNTTNAPTILVNGGSLTMRGTTVVAAGYQTALLVTAGSVDLGTTSDLGGNTLKAGGRGELIHNAGLNPLPALGNVFQVDGLTLLDPYALEDAIFHALDAHGGGLVSYVPGNVFVTRNSGSMQRAVDAAAAGTTINVQASAAHDLPDYTVGSKILTIALQNGPTLSQHADTLLGGALSLFVTGTAGADHMRFRSGDKTTSVVVDIQDVPRGTFAPPGRLVAHGLGGNDDSGVSGNLTLSAWLYGDEGNDRLQGGGRADILVGGGGDDELLGGQGRDILLGGAGRDRLQAGPGDDLLIGGTTSYDANEAALLALSREWASRADYVQRVGHLTGQISGGLNGTNLLKKTTVFDDAAQDKLGGGSGRDLYFAGANDSVTGGPQVEASLVTLDQLFAGLQDALTKKNKQLVLRV